MTPHEFAQGWKLLIVQPWGWRYRSVTAEGKPSEDSQLQLEFYYHHLKFGHPEAWMKTAHLFAAGDAWPSVHEVRTTLQLFHPRCTQALTDQRPDTRSGMPDALRIKLQEDGLLKTMPAEQDDGHAY